MLAHHSHPAAQFYNVVFEFMGDLKQSADRNKRPTHGSDDLSECFCTRQKNPKKHSLFH